MGRLFTRCCRQGCCNQSNGGCIRPASRVSKISARQLELEIREIQVGLGSILLADAVNARVEIPRFEEGTTGPVYVTATRIDPAQPASLQLTVSPISAAQCSETIAPNVTQLLVPMGTSVVTRTFERIAKHENLVMIQNGQPGLRRIRIQVNGAAATDHWLPEGVSAVLDLGNRLTEDENVVKVMADGRAGSGALVIIAEDPDADAAARETPAAMHPILWEPSSSHPGQNLTWSR